MTCKHKHIKSENCVLYCMDCGERLPDDYFRRKKAANTPVEAEPAETPDPAEPAANTPKKGGRKKVVK